MRADDIRARFAKRIADESGQFLLELVIAMAFLTIAVGALMSVFASSMISLRDAGISGTAHNLAERQMEVYKKVPFTLLNLSAATIPAVSDPYFTTRPSTIPAGFTPVTGAAATLASCSFPTFAQRGCATQMVEGPDGRTYRVDSYIVVSTPPGGRPGVTIAIAVRRVVSGSIGPIKAEVSSAYDPSSPTS